MDGHTVVSLHFIKAYMQVILIEFQYYQQLKEYGKSF